VHRPLRILHVVPRLDAEGVGGLVTTLAVAQARCGDEPTVVCLAGEPDPGLMAQLAERRVGVIRLDGSRDIAMAVRVRAVARRTLADVVHTHGDALASGLLAQAFPRRVGVHAVTGTEPQSLRWLVRLTGMRLHAEQSITEATVRELYGRR